MSERVYGRDARYARDGYDAYRGRAPAHFGAWQQRECNYHVYDTRPGSTPWPERECNYHVYDARPGATPLPERERGVYDKAEHSEETVGGEFALLQSLLQSLSDSNTGDAGQAPTPASCPRKAEEHALLAMLATVGVKRSHDRHSKARPLAWVNTNPCRSSAYEPGSLQSAGDYDPSDSAL